MKELNFSKWCFIGVAILSLIQIICAVTSGEVAIGAFVCSELTSVVFALCSAGIITVLQLKEKNESETEK